MNTEMTPKTPAARWTKPVAILALVFGVMTVFSGGNVLFGPMKAQEMAGNFISFVVWFNFLAGFLYITAAVGIWLGKSWALPMSIFIAAATVLIGLAFGFQVMQGAEFEMRTVGALILRAGLWTAIAMVLGKAKPTSRESGN